MNQQVAFPPSSGGTFSAPEFGDTTESITVPAYTPSGSYTETISQSQSDLSGGVNATPSGYSILSSSKSTNSATSTLSFNANGSDTNPIVIHATEPSECFINSSHSYEATVNAVFDGLTVNLFGPAAVSVTGGDELTFQFVPQNDQQPAGTTIYISVYTK